MSVVAGRRALIAGLGLAVASALAAAASPAGREALGQAVGWLRAEGALGGAIAILAAAVGIPLGLPTLWFAALIGYLFGAVAGPPVALVATLAGAMVAFAIARLLFRARIEALVARRKRWRAVVTAIGDGGPRLVVLLRLAGPHNLLNVVLAATPLTPAQFAAGSLLGLAPSVVLASLGGAAVHDPTALWSALDQLGSAALVVLGIGAAALIAAAVVVVRATRRALAGGAPAPLSPEVLP